MDQSEGPPLASSQAAQDGLIAVESDPTQEANKAMSSTFLDNLNELLPGYYYLIALFN